MEMRSQTTTAYKKKFAILAGVYLMVNLAGNILAFNSVHPTYYGTPYAEEMQMTFR